MKETSTAEIETNSQTMQNIPPESYQKYWAEIDSLDKQRLPKSALEKVNALYKIAIDDKNGPQEVKCLLYKFKYEQELNESGFSSGLLMLEQKIDSLDFPAQALMQSYLASLYQNYLDQNLWQIQNRTTLSDPKDDDIETWPYDQLVGKINSLYFKSLDHNGLTEVSLESVKELLNNFDKNEKRRTTLFDLLAFEAIDYFKNERYGLNQPVYAFQIEDEAAFADAKTFTDHTFETKDSTSFKWYTLLLFQKTLKEQMKAGNDVALVDADLQRLSFVRNNTTLANKDELYKKALNNLKAELEGNELQALILFELAELSRSEGQQYEAQAYWQEESPEQLALKNKFIEAANICKEATKKYPGSVGAKKCQALLARLESKSLGLTTEAMFPEGKNILAKLQYHNLDRAFIKVVKIDEKKLQDFEDTRWNERMKFINELPVGSSWEINLPDPKDYRMHSIEFSVPKQELGQYFLVVSDNTNFTDEGGAVSYALIQVSNLALVHINNNDSDKKLFVVTNRIDGKPVSDVRVEFIINDYAQLTRKQFQKTVGNATSDKNGMFYFKTSEHHNFKIKMRKGYDVQSPNEFFYTYPNGNEKTNHSIQYFLDRKIYRPGQTVHFKALVLNNDENRIPSIVTNEKLDFTFYDANGQAVETIQLLTNEYGSCSGSFTAPSSGLFGNMSIRCTGNLSRMYENSVNFRVEEYKRPKFEVSLDENKEEISREIWLL
ncbi:MAG: MG2 domain-containing protein [Saprospiraceae bacterium]